MNLNKAQFLNDYVRRLKSESAKAVEDTTTWDRYHALGTVTKEYLTDDWVNTIKAYTTSDAKQVFYFSMEFLNGRFLINNLNALGIRSVVEEAFHELGFELSDIEAIEKDQGLGNGGLGRLAACFLDSLASIGLPGHGVGIRYNYGLFEQKIVNGYQVEYPDRWLENRNVWEVKKPDKAVEVKFGGYIRQDTINGRLVFIHEDYESVLAVPYDTPIPGYDNGIVNTLRLYSAETMNREFDFMNFNRGDYSRAFENKHNVEAISQVLYPNDSYDEGKQLRLKQEYFFVSAGVQGIIRSHIKRGRSIYDLDKFVSIHVNDTHPALAIPELMRILMDIHEMTWDDAWKITTNVISYTNHTILHEAMEKWPIDLFQKLLPRVYMITHEINERFCRELWVRKYDGDLQKISEMAIISNGMVRMANLCVVGSHSVNGVAKLHSEILKNRELKDLYDFYPQKFNNKTNGITHRRWLMYCNPKLTNLINERIGDSWIHEPLQLEELLKFKDDKAFLDDLMAVKQANKDRLAKVILERNGIVINPKSIFDIQVKRLHEYKRQTLNILHIMHLYNELREHPELDVPPRTFIFGAKAAPGYYIAKQIIKLINSVADVVNNDKRVNDKLKVVFMENYGVSLAELLMPAADVSEQISTTTKEASGTGNMKFMMNGAVTIATLDGANVEIEEQVGRDNIFIFGLKENEVYNYYANRNYNAYEIYQSDPRIQKVLNQLSNGHLRVMEGEFAIIQDSLIRHNDEYFVLKDFDSYAAAHKQLAESYRDKYKWAQMSLTNIAKSGIFSSDNTINQYAKEIWRIKPLK